MNPEQWYQRTTLAEMRVKRYVTTREMRNGLAVVPSGTVVEILHKRSGLTLRTTRCQHCGVQVVISGVEPWNVRELEAT